MLSDVVCKYIPILLFAQVFVINNQNINIYNILHDKNLIIIHLKPIVAWRQPSSFGENSLLTRSNSRRSLPLTEGRFLEMTSSSRAWLIGWYSSVQPLIVALNIFLAADLTM